jgi:hypothetical protein
MATTRKYLDTQTKPNPLSLLIVILLLAAILGVLVYVNIEIWSAIF